MRVVFVIGQCYAGKTFLARRLAQAFGYEYSTPGDWLRIQRDRDSPLGHYIRQNYNYECLDPLVTEFVASAIQYSVQLYNGIIIDGFPRTPYQASMLPRLCLNNHFLVLNLEQVSRDEAIRRAMIRHWLPPYVRRRRWSTAVNVTAGTEV